MALFTPQIVSINKIIELLIHQLLLKLFVNSQNLWISELF